MACVMAVPDFSLFFALCMSMELGTVCVCDIIAMSAVWFAVRSVYRCKYLIFECDAILFVGQMCLNSCKCV